MKFSDRQTDTHAFRLLCCLIG